MHKQELKGRVALVTGSDQGIGKATAIELARRGANVIIHCRPRRQSEKKAEEIRAFIEREFGCWAGILTADFLNRQEINELFDTLEEEIKEGNIPGLDILVNNAAMAKWKGIAGRFNREPLDEHELTLEDLDYSYQINIAGPYQCVKRAYPLMKNGGRIVNVSSFATEIIRPSAVDYTVVKGALDYLTRSLAVDFRTKGYDICVNAVKPGFVDTRSLKLLMHDPKTRQWIEWIKARYGEDIIISPEEIAVVLADFCSFDMNVTGEVLTYDRGVTLFLKQHQKELEEMLISMEGDGDERME